MNLQSITSLVLLLLSKREELLSLTKDAVALFQRAKSLWPTLADDLAEVVVAPAQAPKSTEYTVKWLQESLNILTDANLTVDGSYGEATRKAVTAFQQTNELTADGWAGVDTQAAIVKALAL